MHHENLQRINQVPLKIPARINLAFQTFPLPGFQEIMISGASLKLGHFEFHSVLIGFTLSVFFLTECNGKMLNNISQNKVFFILIVILQLNDEL